MNIKETIQLLGIQDVTTKRQRKNGTIIWKLPIKKYGKFIEVGSFESGYVRRMNGCYTPYQLNKREKYSKYYKYNTDGFENPQTAYYKIDHYNRILIPNEVDRLEYLIAFCLKNYYINQANKLSNGEYIPKWKHEHALERHDVDRDLEVKVIVNGHRYNVI